MLLSDINEKWRKQYLKDQGNELRTKRLTRGFSLQDLARQLGIHRNTLSAIEGGRHDYLSFIGG